MHKLSVIINSYNANQKLLSDAIDSILDQTGVKTQCIVSTVYGDPAVETSRRKRVGVVLSKKPSLYGQLNKALRNIDGDWFFYFSGNDIAMKNKAVDEINLCIKNNKSICYSSFYKTDSNLNNKKLTKFYDYIARKHYCGNFVADVSTIKTSLLDRYAPFDGSLINAAFWDFWLRVEENEPGHFIYNDNPTWLYRIQETSRHVIRKSDKSKILENHRQKASMLRKHKLYLKKYSLEGELTKLERSISELEREVSNAKKT